MKKAVLLFILALGFVRAVSASAETEPSSEAGETQTYTVQWGDRLEEVAARFGLTPEELLAANPRSSYGMKCRSPRTVTLRNGEQQAICGGDEPYLVAEKTLVIPASRHVLETENDRLNNEVVALQAELAELTQEREVEKAELAELTQERDDLASERDELQSENKALVAAEAETQGRHDELQSNLETVLSRQPKQVEVQKSNPDHIALAVLITVSVFLVLLLVILHRKGKKEKSFSRLVQITLPRAEELAAQNKKRAAELHEWTKRNEDRERELDDLQTELDRQGKEQKHQDEDLREREKDLAQGQRELTAAKQAVEDRETSCLGREGEILEAEQGLQERSTAFSSRVQDEGGKLDRLQRELTDLKAEFARREEALAVREGTVAARERECEMRADALTVWEERLRDRDPDSGEEVTTQLPLLDDGDPTFLDPPGQAVSKCLCPECGVEVPLDEIEEHRTQVHGGDPPDSPDDDTIVCGACGRRFPDRREFDEHRSECPDAVPHTPTLTGDLAAGTGRRPSSAGQSVVYCKTCQEGFSPEEYARDHAKHDTGLPKPK